MHKRPQAAWAASHAVLKHAAAISAPGPCTLAWMTLFQVSRVASGFTARSRWMAEAAPPEETIELLNNYYALMFDAIAGEGGVVTLMVGDGLMAVFGAPMPLPQHEAHAVRAALEMIELVELFSRERVAQGKAPVRIGIGIASGEMVAGYAGTQARATYTCIGDVVNLAARIEQHTKVAGRAVLVDQATRDALPADIATESLGPVEFKGFSAACATFAVKLATA